MQGIFDRTELLIGKEALAELQSKHVIIFGVGGVGSWCAESLVRTGISHLTIVDPDCVSVTNVNRQLMATTKTIGRPKVEVLKERLLDINPDAEIIALQERYEAGHGIIPSPLVEMPEGQRGADGFHYIIDCIDSLKDKAALLVNATQTDAKVFSSMGAALKVDPTQIRVAEFWKVRGCPLGAALRKKLKHNHLELSQKVMCVYSEELLQNRGTSDETCSYKAQINGSLSHITAIFGFTIAGLLIQDAMSSFNRELPED